MSQKDNGLDTVIFRKWRKTGEIIALFPGIAADLDGKRCQSYEHIRQHGGVEYNHVIRQTTKATPIEYGALKSELEKIGYALRIKNRASKKMYRKM